jgi:hypothetical protein
MRFAKIVFNVAGVYGLLVLLPQYFLEAKYGRDYPPAVTHPEFYYGFVGVAVAFQLVFLLIARDPARHRALMLASVVEKASFGLAAPALYLQGRSPAAVLVPAGIDLALGVLFALAYLRTSGASSHPGGTSRTTP